MQQNCSSINYHNFNKTVGISIIVIMIASEEAQTSAEDTSIFTLIREYWQLHPDREFTRGTDPKMFLSQTGFQWVGEILQNSPKLQHIRLRQSFYSGFKPIRQLMGVKKSETQDEIRQLLSGLLQLGYQWKDDAELRQVVGVINASQFKGRVYLEYCQDITEYDFETLFTLRKPLVLGLSEISLSSNMIQLLGRLHSILHQIGIEYVNCKYPQLFVNVLNSLQNLETIFIRGERETLELDLTLLKSNVKNLQIHDILLPPDSLPLILKNNPLVENLCVCGMTNEHLTLLPLQKETKIKVLIFDDSERQSITLTGIMSVVQNYQSLLGLILKGYSNIGNEAVILISTLQSLQTLGLRSFGYSQLIAP